MSENNKQLTKKEIKSLDQCDMETLQYRPNEASFNYNGITLNIDIPKFVDCIKSFAEKQKEKKALKELKKMENKILTDVQQHENYVIIDEDIEDVEGE